MIENRYTIRDEIEAGRVINPECICPSCRMEPVEPRKDTSGLCRSCSHEQPQERASDESV